jgi:hypothetical protein
MRMSLVDQDRAPEDLHDVDARELAERVSRREPIVGAVGVDAHLHQLVILERLLDLLEHGGRGAALPDLHDRRQVMSVSAQRMPQLAGRHQRPLFGVGRRSHAAVLITSESLLARPPAF